MESIYISPTDFRAGAGKFDARRRYLRAGNTLENFPICPLKTLDVRSMGFSNFWISTYRYSVAGYVRQTLWNPSNGGISAGGYNAPFILVTT